MEESSMPELPGGPTKLRPLHFMWICDCFGAMAGDKIRAVNFAICEASEKKATA